MMNSEERSRLVHALFVFLALLIVATYARGGLADLIQNGIVSQNVDATMSNSISLDGLHSAENTLYLKVYLPNLAGK